MEPTTSHERGTKRKLVPYKCSCNKDEVHQFRILLPNGTNVQLRLAESKSEMSFEEFINLVKNEYFHAQRRSPSKKIRSVNWDDGCLYLEDTNGRKITHKINIAKFKPYKCHILQLRDESGMITNTYENMWDLKPDTDLLREIPEEYTTETALADLIDNSLQAVWFNHKNHRRLISVDILEDRISIFDSGPGMDDSDENSIVKWGRMGASLHRSFKTQAIGGKPPYLKPSFGMFGYGGPIASMHLGRRAIVSSKRKESRKVYMLHLERDTLLNNSGSETTWKMDGGLRDPLQDEIEKSPHGSFTKVEILELNIKNLSISQLQCKIKDIFFPYIQCDEVSKSGKTTRPVKFEINGVDLAEIEGGEVSITNLHSCMGHEFVCQLHFSIKQDDAATSGPGLRESQEANARLKCVYFPIAGGKENIEKILEKLDIEGCGIAESYETFSRVSIRRLGRLLPDARWATLPFMEFRQKKGHKAHLLKRFFLRVKCFIETDAGFNPTPSKTDLVHQNPFTIALKNFGNKSFGKVPEVNIDISRDGKHISPLQLEKEYQDWILHMHEHYDEEFHSGEDDPVLLVGPTNKKKLGISSDVVRVHQILNKKGTTWKRGQKIKVLRGACAGFHKSNVYAIIEYFLIEGLEGDAGGGGRIICRALGLADENACVLLVDNENVSLDIRGSLSIPISVIDSGKCQAMGSAEWDNQLEKQFQKAPSKIELLCAEHCKELEIGGALPADATVYAGQVPPREIVAVVRPVSYISSSASNILNRKHIIKINSEMIMEVKFRNKTENIEDHVYSERVPPSSCKGFNGLYVFSLSCKCPNLFRRAGVYTFAFSLGDSSCKKCEKTVVVSASSEVGRWKLLSDRQIQLCSVSAGSFFPSFCIACYDIYDNRIPFPSMRKLKAKLITHNGAIVQLDRPKASLSSNKLTLKVKDVLIESNNLDRLRPSYNATLLICPQDELVSVSIPCLVTSGRLQHVTAQPPIRKEPLLPGFVVKELVLEMCDDYGNHLEEGSEVQLNVDGFRILDRRGSKQKVDDNGCIDLGGLLEVTAGFGKIVSISISSEDKVIFKQEFQTERRELRLASTLPEFCIAGSQLENIVFQVVNDQGDVDEGIHDELACGQPHMLTIKSHSFNSEDPNIQYIFKHGCCTVPAIPIPPFEGSFRFIAAHSCYSELQLSFNVFVMRVPKVETEFPCTDGKVLLHGDLSPHEDAGNLMLSVMSKEKRLGDAIFKHGMKIGSREKALRTLIDQKTRIKQAMFELQGSMEPFLLNNLNHLSMEEETVEKIESKSNSAASVLCHLSRYFSFQDPQKNFMEDIVGLVALLGTVHTNELSRILAEYLSEDCMLAFVCRSYKTANLLEKYQGNGKVDRKLALHAEAAALGKFICGRFLVICLEDIRPYTGQLEGGDLQGKLALPNPTFPSGHIASGFLGYAVNMINLDIHHLNMRANAGYGLRETLFYRLFGKLQVYDTREHMIEARACIKHGAVSLDGGILRENGIISLGYGNPEICFPISTLNNEMLLSQQEMENLKQIGRLKAGLNEIMCKIETANQSLEKHLKMIRKKSKEYEELTHGMGHLLEDLPGSDFNNSEIVPRYLGSSSKLG